MVTVENSCHRIDLLREQPQIELGIALLHHPPKETRRIDSTGWAINGRAISANALDVTLHALVLLYQLRAQAQISTLEDRRLGLGPSRPDQTGR